jgi:hypothetical protein
MPTAPRTSKIAAREGALSAIGLAVGGSLSDLISCRLVEEVRTLPADVKPFVWEFIKNTREGLADPKCGRKFENFMKLQDRFTSARESEAA